MEGAEPVGDAVHHIVELVCPAGQRPGQRVWQPQPPAGVGQPHGEHFRARGRRLELSAGRPGGREDRLGVADQLIAARSPAAAGHTPAGGGALCRPEPGIGGQPGHRPGDRVRVTRLDQETADPVRNQVERAPAAGATAPSPLAAASCRVLPKAGAVRGDLGAGVRDPVGMGGNDSVTYAIRTPTTSPERPEGTGATP